MSEKIFYAKDRKEWRDWLSKNHDKETKISLLIYKKHTGKPSLNHRESMEEAICFGWIDTTLKSLDGDTYIRRFSKRTKNSRWSTNTLSYAKNLIGHGLMTSHGLKFYEEGLKKLPLDHGRSKNPEPGKDLIQALTVHKALDNFNKLAPSHRRTYIYWIDNAKREETRAKRIEDTVKRVKAGKKAFD